MTSKKVVKDKSHNYGTMNEEPFVRSLVSQELEDINNLTIDNFDYKKEYIKLFNFISMESNSFSYDLVKLATKVLDRKGAITQIEKAMGEMYNHFASEIEKGLFEFALVYVTINELPNEYINMVYSAQLNEIVVNLDINNKEIGNKTLLPSLLDGSIKPTFVARLSPQQMNPANWKYEMDKANIKDDAINNLQTTDLYVCKKCKNRKFKVSTCQTRCADEPETKFFVCTVCYFTFTQ